MGGLPIQMPSLGRTTSRARVRDEPNVSTWFDGALPRIFGYFLPRVGGNIQTAEDLTQETMLAAVRSQNGGTNVEQIMPWLFGIARHKLVDHYRQANHHTEPGDDNEVAVDVDRLPSLDLNTIHVRDAVIATLDTLPPRQRLAIVLRYLDDQPVADVATSLDLSLQATESLLARARRTFRSHYLASNGDRS
jgi:RNA polymerase sigma-70 factor (ECF subfamily)